MRCGSQQPRIKVEPVRLTSDGPDAAELYEYYASPLDEWQKGIIDSWLGKDDNGNYNVTSASETLPRQNGKNVTIEAREFYGLVINGEKILHTAHQVKTAKKSFRRLEAIFTDPRFPELKAIVKNIRYTNGEECIELTNGGTIEYSARSRQAARGFDGISLVVFDEAQELTDEQLEAILATLSASATGTRQMIFAGTAPYPNCPGTVFKRKRKSALDNPGPHEAWHEWSVDGASVEEIKADDHLLWYNTNPAMGIRLSEEFTEEEFKTMSIDGFCRERLNWWMPEASKEEEHPITEELWDACSTTSPLPKGKTAYGVKFSLDGSEVCLAGAIITEDGKIRIEMIDRKSTNQGTRWLAEWLNKRYAKASCVVIDGRNGVDVLIDRLQDTWKAKDSIIRPKTNDVIAASGYIIDGLMEQNLNWFEPQTALRESALSATKRPIRGGWGFGGENSTPIEACSLALFGAKTSKRNPGKEMRIG